MVKSRPTEEEFAALKEKRDAELERIVDESCKKLGMDRSKVIFHASPPAFYCYCDCPDGPCQHIWGGPDIPLGLEEGEDESQAHGWSSTCSKCGAGFI